MNPSPDTADRPVQLGSERDILLTLFDLGRQVTSVIDIDELLPRIPELIGRLIPFDAFAVYFVNEKRSEISIGYAVGYPDESVGLKAPLSSGLVGQVITTQQPVVLGDVSLEPNYVSIVPGMMSTLAVPLIHKA